MNPNCEGCIALKDVADQLRKQLQVKENFIQAILRQKRDLHEDIKVMRKQVEECSGVMGFEKSLRLLSRKVALAKEVKKLQGE